MATLWESVKEFGNGVASRTGQIFSGPGTDQWKNGGEQLKKGVTNVFEGATDLKEVPFKAARVGVQTTAYVGGKATSFIGRVFSGELFDNKGISKVFNNSHIDANPRWAGKMIGLGAMMIGAVAVYRYIRGRREQKNEMTAAKQTDEMAALQQVDRQLDQRAAAL